MTNQEIVKTEIVKNRIYIRYHLIEPPCLASWSTEALQFSVNTHVAQFMKGRFSHLLFHFSFYQTIQIFIQYWIIQFGKNTGKRFKIFVSQWSECYCRLTPQLLECQRDRENPDQNAFDILLQGTPRWLLRISKCMYVCVCVCIKIEFQNNHIIFVRVATSSNFVFP